MYPINKFWRNVLPLKYDKSSLWTTSWMWKYGVCVLHNRPFADTNSNPYMKCFRLKHMRVTHKKAPFSEYYSKQHTHRMNNAKRSEDSSMSSEWSTSHFFFKCACIIEWEWKEKTTWVDKDFCLHLFCVCVLCVCVCW